MSARAQLRRYAGRVGPEHGPWIRARQLQRWLGAPEPGQPVAVLDRRGEVLGWGLPAERSSIAVRMLQWGPEAPPHDWLAQRLAQALAAREAQGWADQPTTGIRLVNSEGDGLPGLVVDRYDEQRVVQLTTASMVAHQAAIVDALRGASEGPVHVVRPEGPAALEGFVRSLAKEVGKRGSTAQLLTVAEGAEDRVEPVLRFLLSARSAFISGQPVHVDARALWPSEVPVVRPLEGKVALVTGAARGIGAATCELLAAEGAHVICLDRPEDDALASQVARTVGGSVLLADVSDPAAPKAIAAEIAEHHGGVDIVVHNAGVTRDKTLARMKPEQWDQALDINLAAVVRITEELTTGLLRDGGRVVLLSSVAGIAGNMGQTNYAASKSGIIGYTGKLAEALASQGITVNAVAPGFIETRLTAAIPVMIREVARRLANLGQGGLPQDVGEAITFLCTPGAAGITGRVLRVCGGALVGA
ncbi:MAG: 3-oxoacyl-ACP reductase [Myxococcales bacterium]|nr:3-oxoacyl-ACP reductase [Myxococcales bacterium]